MVLLLLRHVFRGYASNLRRLRPFALSAAIGVLAALLGAAPVYWPLSPVAVAAVGPNDLKMPWKSSDHVTFNGGPHAPPPGKLQDCTEIRSVASMSGLDFGMGQDTHVLAVADGVVSGIEPNVPGIGNVVWVDHPRLGIRTGYWHLHNFATTIGVGSTVIQGQLLGYSGAPPTSPTAFHLHLEFRDLSAFPGQPVSASGMQIDGYTAWAWTITSDPANPSAIGMGYNYEGTLTQGSTSTKSFSPTINGVACGTQVSETRGSGSTFEADETGVVHSTNIENPPPAPTTTIVTSDCSSPTLLANVQAGARINVVGTLNTVDPNENGEGEPLSIQGPGSFNSSQSPFVISNYATDTPAVFVASSSGALAACIPNGDGDENATVRTQVAFVPNPVFGQAVKNAFLSSAAAQRIALNARILIASGCAYTGPLAPSCALPFAADVAAEEMEAQRLNQLALNPPDQNFTQVAQPVTPTMSAQPFVAGQGLSQAEADAINAVLTNLEQQIGLEQAMLTAANRASGAQLAGDSTSQAMQVQAAQQFAAELAQLTSATPALYANLQNAYAAAGFQRSFTVNDVLALEQTIASQGLPPVLAKDLADLGADAATQNQIQQLLIVQDINAVATIGGGRFPDLLTDPTELASFQQTSQVLSQFAGIQADTIPPTTTATLTPQPNAAGWNDSNVTVGLSAVDNTGGSGVKQLAYSASGAQTIASLTISQPTTSVLISIEGSTTLSFAATDNAGNTEQTKTVTVLLDKTPPTTTATLDGKVGKAGWFVGPVTLRLSATDALSGVAVSSYSSDGGATWSTYAAASPPVFAKDGRYTVLVRSTDIAGNVEAARSVAFNIDQTPPMVTCTVSPNVLWPPNHALVRIAATVNVADSLSGPAGFTLVSLTSNEPDNGLGDGDTPNDIQGWVLGSASTSGQLRAERSGSGSGRVYTLTYVGSDVAGNTSTCVTTVTVPHDHS